MAKVIPIIKAESLIPSGMYCYAGLEQDKEDPMRFNLIGLCPFWSSSDEHHEQDNGSCSYAKLNDWEHGTLLWDQVKECGVKLDD
jgi:pentatricopeptide repeat protein